MRVEANSAASPRLTRREAARRIRELHGLPCTAETLATKAWNGSGPPYRLVAGKTYYNPADVDRWAQSRIGPPVRKAADARRAIQAGEATSC
jgi:hypothetical protein